MRVWGRKGCRVWNKNPLVRARVYFDDVEMEKKKVECYVNGWKDMLGSMQMSGIFIQLWQYSFM